MHGQPHIRFNNGLFPPTCEEVWNGWLYTGSGWLEKLLSFQCLIFAVNWKTSIWNSRVSSSLKFWRDRIMPLKNDRCRFCCFPSSSAFIILSSNSSGLRFSLPHCCVRGFREGDSWEKLFISSLFCSAATPPYYPPIKCQLFACHWSVSIGI